MIFKKWFYEFRNKIMKTSFMNNIVNLSNATHDGYKKDMPIEKEIRYSIVYDMPLCIFFYYIFIQHFIFV